jgi:hypothetical protein
MRGVEFLWARIQFGRPSLCETRTTPPEELQVDSRPEGRPEALEPEELVTAVGCARPVPGPALTGVVVEMTPPRSGSAGDHEGTSPVSGGRGYPGSAEAIREGDFRRRGITAEIRNGPQLAEAEPVGGEPVGWEQIPSLWPALDWVACKAEHRDIPRSE